MLTFSEWYPDRQRGMDVRDRNIARELAVQSGSGIGRCSEDIANAQRVEMYEMSLIATSPKSVQGYSSVVEDRRGTACGTRLAMTLILQRSWYMQWKLPSCRELAKKRHPDSDLGTLGATFNLPQIRST